MSPAGRTASLLLLLVPAACGAEPAGDVRASEPPSAPAPDPDDPRLEEVFELLSRGDRDAARELAETVLADHPGHGRAELLLGLAHARDQHWGLALPHLEAAARHKPAFEGQAGAWYTLGWCRFWLGRLEPAREAFEEALARAPDRGDARLGLGAVELEQGRLDAAETHLGEALARFDARLAAGEREVARQAAEAHARLADVHLLREETAAARDELRACVELWPRDHAAWYKLWRVLLDLGEDEDAAWALVQHRQWKARAEAEGGG